MGSPRRLPLQSRYSGIASLPQQCWRVAEYVNLLLMFTVRKGSLSEHHQHQTSTLIRLPPSLAAELLQLQPVAVQVASADQLLRRKNIKTSAQLTKGPAPDKQCTNGFS